MVSLIRDEPEDIEADVMSDDSPHRSSGIFTRSVLGLLFIVLAGMIAVIAINMPRLGLPAFMLLCACLLVVAVLMLSLVIKPRQVTDMTDGPHPDAALFVEAFMQSREPGVLMRGGKPVRANPAYMDLAGSINPAWRAAKQARGSIPSIDELFAIEDPDVIATLYRLNHAQGENAGLDDFIDVIDDEGVVRRFRIHVSAVKDVQLWQISDITASTQAKDTTLAAAPVGLFSMDEEGQIVAANPVLMRWLGADTALPPGHVSEFLETTSFLLDVEKVIGRITRSETRLITHKGAVSPVIVTVSWQTFDNGRWLASVALYGHSYSHDGSHLQTSAEGAREERGDDVLSLDIFNRSPVAIVELNGADISQAKMIKTNPVFEDITAGQFGPETTFYDMFAPGSIDKGLLEKAHVSGEPFEARLKGEADISVSIYLTADVTDPDRFWAYMVDVSARKALEDQLRQSQKMQAIGQLAAGVAHDFNNLLTTIRLNTDDLLGRHPVGDPSYPELQSINNTVHRAAALVKKLLAFSRKQTLRMERLDVTETLSDIAASMKQPLGERVKLNMQHGRDLPDIRADKSQLDMVFLNLCVNARDAMDAQGGGHITITTQQVGRAELDNVGIADVTGDDFVAIYFSDTGMGMTEEVRSKIFEPFFTTKEQGKGTGLGLATVYGIIQQSGGYLAVDSVLGEGTTFKIYLPVDTSIEDSPAPVKTVRTPPKPVDLTGQGTILFVEDESSVRTIAAKTLRNRGYKVVEAEDGEEAYDILEEGAHTFDLLISDVVMPGMDGPTLLRKGRDLLGDARIVFISGYAEEEFSELLSEEPDVTFLPKPFTLSQLAEKVKAEIGESADV